MNTKRETIAAQYECLKNIMPDHDARYVLLHVAGVTWSDIVAQPERPCPSEVSDNINDLIKRFQKGEPLSRITGVQEFWGLEFNLSPATLDPRPDSEVLVEAALKHFGNTPPTKFADFGTGTGCLAIALLTEWPQSQAILVDLSFEALQMARQNAQKHGVDNRCVFVQGSWGESLAAHSLDALIANPPYIRGDVILELDENVQKHDPILALDGGKDGLQAYCQIFSDIFRLLKSEGRGFLEIGFDQADDMMRLSKNYRIRIHSILPDYAGNPRVVDISCGDK